MDALTAFLLLYLAVAIVILFVTGHYTWRLIRTFIHGGGPYVPSDEDRVRTMIELSAITPEDTIMDLGCGDGRLVFAAAEAGARRAVGCDIDPQLVRQCNEKLTAKKPARPDDAGRSGGLDARVQFVCENLWKTDVSGYSVVFLYQLPPTMKRLEQKLLAELPSGARVVSNAFVFPSWKPAREAGNVRLYVKV